MVVGEEEDANCRGFCSLRRLWRRWPGEARATCGGEVDGREDFALHRGRW